MPSGRTSCSVLETGTASYLCYLAYHLIGWILLEEDFDGLESLIAYCGKSDNFAYWLTDQVDQVVVSLELERGLRDLPPGGELPPTTPIDPAASRPAIRDTGHQPEHAVSAEVGGSI